MVTDAKKTKTEADLAAEREADRKRREAQIDTDPFSKLFSGMNAGGGFFAFLGKIFQALLGSSGLGSLFGGVTKSISSSFSDFKDGVSGRDDTPLAPKGAKLPEKSISARIGSGLRTGWNGVLDLIGQHESGGDYNRVYGKGVKRVDLTHMTIDDVQKWQRDYVNSGSRSSAAGKYQIMQETMADLKKKMGLTGKELFDEKMQDAMALKLLERRGISSFAAGKMTTGQIINSIADEWAAVKKDGKSKGAYDDKHGGNLNRATLDSSKMAVVLEQAKADELTANRATLRKAETQIALNTVPPKPAKSSSPSADMTKVAAVTPESIDPIADRKVKNGVFNGSYGEGAKATQIMSAAPVAHRSIDKGVFNGDYNGSMPAQVAVTTPSTKTDRNINIAMTAGLNT